eukprot:5620777-Amphidinium_carterae.1
MHCLIGCNFLPEDSFILLQITRVKGEIDLKSLTHFTRGPQPMQSSCSTPHSGAQCGLQEGRQVPPGSTPLEPVLHKGLLGWSLQ